MGLPYVTSRPFLIKQLRFRSLMGWEGYRLYRIQMSCMHFGSTLASLVNSLFPRNPSHISWFIFKGIVVSVTLATQPLYKVTAFNSPFPDSVLTDGTAINWARQADQMALYWFPSTSTVIVANWTIVDVNKTGNAFTYDHVPSTSDVMKVTVYNSLETLQELSTSTCVLQSQTGK